MADLIDRIYEAAVVPEFWPDVLDEIARRAGSTSGALLLIDQRAPPLYTATPNIIDILADYAAGPYWYKNDRLARYLKLNYSGFLEVSHYVDPNIPRTGNPYDDNLERMGASWQVGSAIIMPEGDLALFTFERESHLDNFDGKTLSLLDGLRPHLARASLINARLGLQKLQAQVDGLSSFAIPAAALRRDGSVIVANTEFEALSHVLRPAAFGKVRPLDRRAADLLSAAIEAIGHQSKGVLSIPCRNDDDTTLVLHVLPLHRQASDLYDMGWALLAVTGFSPDANVAPQNVLRGLFDLSAAEAGVAAGLSSGHTLQELAIERGVSITTIRSHLAQIFRKTGTGHQAQLVALLKGTISPVE
ncbi:MAG: helix-turn-helix transcriptional regulator [Devosia sp.]|uniref:helix-turn-helix transcriptional regulator n=1 Tax=Devosia sp. TaxID=1871048 RepID=UPI0024CACDDC|nr:helix-turn-helix transcriptional regulator [Devosia sp.]UYN98461.1 MAG: helix-turn-helix transcriptional regulator [Devosia sp.]